MLLLFGALPGSADLGGGRDYKKKYCNSFVSLNLCAMLCLIWCTLPINLYKDFLSGSESLDFRGCKKRLKRAEIHVACVWSGSTIKMKIRTDVSVKEEINTDWDAQSNWYIIYNREWILMLITLIKSTNPFSDL